LSDEPAGLIDVLWSRAAVGVLVLWISDSIGPGVADWVLLALRRAISHDCSLYEEMSMDSTLIQVPSENTARVYIDLTE